MSTLNALHPMATHTLEEAVETLAGKSENMDPVLSLYLSLDQPGANLAQAERQALGMVRDMGRHDRAGAFSLIEGLEVHLSKVPREEGMSLAFFLRNGDDPFNIAVVVPGHIDTKVRVGRLPSIFELVEKKDVYHRYAVVILTTSSARILQVNAGRITESLLAGNLDVRSRLSREITRERYHHHQKDRGQRFFREKVSVLESIVREGEFDHIVLAGEKRLTSSFHKMLPKALADKVLDDSVDGHHNSFDAILRSSMEAFMKAEEKESNRAIERWKQSMAMGGLAIAGPDEVGSALIRGNLDQLLISKQTPKTLADPISLQAIQFKIPIETVDDEDLLINHQGLAGFLRYREHQG